ncbi:hypothetical protein [Yersinia massiliensis]|uniref:hypothetical protein n=1 Tax=Yersinia massiliensis TaxID=419257 RepID=UPI0028D7E0A7|nr:hypothetical protein [Yersinia massiliensis]
MSASLLIFEKVGDINSTYPYLCVYDEIDRLDPFMEISITDDMDLNFVIYQNSRNITIDIQDFELIKTKAIEFFKKVMSDEGKLS